MRKMTAMLTTALIICIAGSVQAQVEPQELLPPTRSTLTASARKLVDEANLLYRAGELSEHGFGITDQTYSYFRDAKADYALAWELTHDPSLAYDVALTLWHMGDLFEAHHWMKVYYGAFERQLKDAHTQWDVQGVVGKQPMLLGDRIVLALNAFMHDAGWNAHTSTVAPVSCVVPQFNRASNKVVLITKCARTFSLVSEDRFRDLCREMGSCDNAEKAIEREKAMLVRQ